MKQVSEYPQIDVTESYNYLSKILKFNLQDIIYEKFISSSSFPSSFHLVGLKNCFVIFHYKFEENHTVIRKFVSLILKQDSHSWYEKIYLNLGLINHEIREQIITEIKRKSL
ncbi:MAG: hypothetical protein ACTSP3_01600 [Candidatus Heimdallarchaeaceae archaeon]